VGTVPAPDSAGVARDARISITFSEKMQRVDFQRYMSFSPDVVVRAANWKGLSVIIVPHDSLHPDTTYLVSVKSGFRDGHGVPNDAGFEWAFATSAAIDSGQVRGRVLFRREPSADAVLRLFVLPRDTIFSLGTARADREVRTDEQGHYTIGYLPTKGTEFALWAFQDENDNNSFELDSEVGLTKADTIRLTATVSTLTRDFAIVDPREPSILTGNVRNETGIDTVLMVVGLYALNDTVSVPKPAYYTRCDTAGTFTLRNVLTGTYTLSAFVDFEADSICGTYWCDADSSRRCREPCAQYPDTLYIDPGADIKLKRFPLPAWSSPDED